jgi:hypothetical protein
MSLGLGLALALGLYAGTPSPALASQVASQIKLDGDDMSQPIVLDQNGHTIHLPTRSYAGATVLAIGAVPSYVAYRADADDSLPKVFPAIETGSARTTWTTGPLHPDAPLKAQLDAALAQDRAVVVSSGPATFLVKSIPSVFGTDGSGDGSRGTSLAWLASQAAAQRSHTKPGSSSSFAAQSVPTSVPQAQSLLPSSVTDPITKSKLVKDLRQLVALKSGKLVNWNSETLRSLESDMRIASPKNVAPHLSTAKSTRAAEELDLSSLGAGAGPRPTPVPEPQSFLVLGLAALGLGVRGRLTRRKPAG